MISRSLCNEDANLQFSQVVIFHRAKLRLGSGKNQKSWFFLLGLKYTFRTCFDTMNKLFAEILYWAEKSGTQFFSLSNLHIVSNACATIRFQLFDIWWSSLNKINDFKAISRMEFFCFGEKNISLFWVLSKKFFFQFFSVVY